MSEPGPGREAGPPLPVPPRAPWSLEPLLGERQLVLVSGKGGTGKSTVVAALAELAARRRGGAVAVEFSAHPRLPEMIGTDSKVEALNIEAEAVVGASLGRLLGLPAIASAVLGNRVLRLFIRTSPAMREMIALDELRFRVEQAAKRGFPVVVDLPATGHALSFLDTPRSVRRMLRVGPLANVARKVEELILDPRRCELLAVALPEELPITETIELVRRCGQIGVSSGAIVVNQVPAVRLEESDRELLDALKRSSAGPLAEFAGAAEGDIATLAQARAHIQRLRDAVGLEIIEVPRAPAPTPRECVLAVVRALAP